MIDKIALLDNIGKDHDVAAENDLFLSPHFRLERRTETGFNGYYKNIKLIKKGNHLGIQGSLTTFGYGTNTVNADAHMINRFLLQLIKEMEISPASIVRELEFGFNVPVSSPIACYLNDMQFATGYKKEVTCYNKEKVFVKTNKRIRIYDKTEHFRNWPGNSCYPADTTLIRYEIVLTDPHTELGLNKPLRLIQLLSPRIKAGLMSIWLEEYRKIVKSNQLKPKFQVKEPKNVIDHLTLKGIEAYGGLKNVLQLINRNTFQKHSNEYTKRVKDRLTALTKDGSLSSYSSSHSELEDKIRFIAIHTLAQLQQK
ncbi:MAG TPA: hypothetical protein VFE32_13785 [Puia sp.]|jgi:hypothetical protein|nr:hypothetical protein [Puia sp.]